MRRTNPLAISICGLVATTGLLYGQGNATIVGVITDASGAASPGSRVTLLNEGTGLRESANSDSAGRYNFSRLAVRNYRIEVSAAGFKTDTRPGINLTAEQVLCPTARAASMSGHPARIWPALVAGFSARRSARRELTLPIQFRSSGAWFELDKKCPLSTMGLSGRVRDAGRQLYFQSSDDLRQTTTTCG